MVKVKSPLFSERASGAVCGNIVFSLRASGQQVRFQRHPIDRASDEQLTRRSVYSDGVDSWHGLSSEDKNYYKDLAKNLHMTGYNYYMKSYLLSHGGDILSAIFGVGIYGTTIYGQS